MKECGADVNGVSNQMTKEFLNKYREIKPSPDGRFQDCWWWTGGKNGQGYGEIWYKRVSFKVHRLSANLYLYFNISSELDVCHHCDNPSCFNPDHLFIGTVKDNMQDMIRKGRAKHSLGEEVHTAKLTEEQVLEIRKSYKESELGIWQFSVITSKKYNCNPTTIDVMLRGKTWKHLL